MKTIPNYEDYAVTEDGKVFSIRKGAFLKPRISRFGYYVVTLYKERKPHTIGVHRLVALAYLGVPESDKLQVNHKNEIKTDNRVENLEWCTCSYNINYGHRNAIVSEKQIANKTASVGRPVEQIDPATGEVVKVWPSVRAIERALGYAHDNIANCCKGVRKTRGGYKWRYAR